MSGVSVFPDTRSLSGSILRENGSAGQRGGKNERKDTGMEKAVRFLSVPVLLVLLIAMIPAALATPDVYTQEELNAMTMVVTADYVNMRAGYAGTDGHKQIINYSDGLMKGEQVYCLDRHNGWYCVLRIQGHKSTVGWVWGDFVSFKSNDVANGGKAKGGDVSNSSSKHVGGSPASDANAVKNHSQYNHVIDTLIDLGKW